MKRIVREITPLTDDDFFIVLDHQNAKFDFPVHYHPEFELNLVLYSKGKRIIGDSIKEYSTADLVLIGPNTPHAWTGDQPGVRVITIQFQENLFGEKTLSRKLTLPIKELLERSKLGIQFRITSYNVCYTKLLRNIAFLLPVCSIQILQRIDGAC